MNRDTRLLSTAVLDYDLLVDSLVRKFLGHRLRLSVNFFLLLRLGRCCCFILSRIPV